MPGATTASVEFLVAAIAWKLFMMPQTVPSRPTNGAVEAIVPSQDRFFSSDSTSRSMVRSITCAIRPTSPRLKVTSMVLGDSRHSSMAVANISAIGWSGRLASWR